MNIVSAYHDLSAIVDNAGPEEVLGLDVGSRSTKYALISPDVNMNTPKGIVDTLDFIYGDHLENISHIEKVVSTGYGRDRVEHGLKIPEIRAHVVGVVNDIGASDFTLLDIGGQDFKVVRVDRGVIRDFHMNDKCAAGTGRFMEKMADMLQMTVERLGKHEGTVRVLESTCSVFTETELISMMMEGRSKEELAGGVVHSVYERVRPYLRMFPSDLVIFTGGVSACSGLARTISNSLEVEVVVPEDAQFMGAMGCAIIGVNKLGSPKQ